MKDTKPEGSSTVGQRQPFPTKLRERLTKSVLRRLWAVLVVLQLADTLGVAGVRDAFGDAGQLDTLVSAPVFPRTNGSAVHVTGVNATASSTGGVLLSGSVVGEATVGQTGEVFNISSPNQYAGFIAMLGYTSGDVLGGVVLYPSNASGDVKSIDVGYTEDASTSEFFWISGVFDANAIDLRWADGSEQIDAVSAVVSRFQGLHIVLNSLKPNDDGKDASSGGVTCEAHAFATSEEHIFADTFPVLKHDSNMPKQMWTAYTGFCSSNSGDGFCQSIDSASERIILMQRNQADQSGYPNGKLGAFESRSDTSTTESSLSLGALALQGQQGSDVITKRAVVSIGNGGGETQIKMPNGASSRTISQSALKHPYLLSEKSGSSIINQLMSESSEAIALSACSDINHTAMYITGLVNGTADFTVFPKSINADTALFNRSHGNTNAWIAKIKATDSDESFQSLDSLVVTDIRCNGNCTARGTSVIQSRSGAVYWSGIFGSSATSNSVLNTTLGVHLSPDKELNEAGFLLKLDSTLSTIDRAQLFASAQADNASTLTVPRENPLPGTPEVWLAGSTESGSYTLANLTANPNEDDSVVGNDYGFLAGLEALPFAPPLSPPQVPSRSVNCFICRTLKN